MAVEEEAAESAASAHNGQQIERDIAQELSYEPTGDITADKAAAYMEGVLAELRTMPKQARLAAMNVVFEWVIRQLEG